MSRQKMITIPADDIVCVRVGSLGDFQEKRKLANNPEYRAQKAREARRPKTMREVLGLPEDGLNLRAILGLSEGATCEPKMVEVGITVCRPPSTPAASVAEADKHNGQAIREALENSVFVKASRDQMGGRRYDSATL